MLTVIISKGLYILFDKKLARDTARSHLAYLLQNSMRRLITVMPVLMHIIQIMEYGAQDNN